MVRRGADPDAFADVWSIDAFDEFLTGNIRRPLVRLVADGATIAAEEYTSSVRLGGVAFRDVVDPTKVARRFAAGATVVGQSLHRTHVSVRRFTEALADEVSHPLQANCYLTPAHSSGLAPHADDHDVIVLQLEGSKQWRVGALEEVVLRPGDVAYIPAGTEHQAVSTASASLHLTLGILRVTYRDVVERTLRTTSDLDAPLPLRYRHSGVRFEDELCRHVKRAADLLHAADVTEIVGGERRRRRSVPPRTGALSAAVVANDVGAATVLVVDDEVWRFTTTNDGRVEVSVDGRRLEAPDSCGAALRRVYESKRTRVGDLIGLDDGSKIILGRRLVASGLCRSVTPE